MLTSQLRGGLSGDLGNSETSVTQQPFSSQDNEWGHAH